eukprot:TRINITY_DN27251_c0_g1_i1.p1 TRINITY_DN27251_c0_g1~~TRINITY_DN27251_c0_g1_i1.p1  ORF type:complete len:423 (-),score=55.47 TRINITY_DN27251_c0_g1_i1:194-1348(-)
MSAALQDCLQKIYHEVASDDAWNPLTSFRGVKVARKTLADYTCSAKFTYVLDVSTDRVTAFYRPEACHVWTVACRDGSKVEIVKSLAPGDAILEPELNSQRRALFNIQAMLEPLLGKSRNLMRFMMRRCFPRVGSTCVVCIPVDSKFALVPGGKLWAKVISEAENGSKTAAEEFLFFSGKWNWLLPLVAIPTCFHISFTNWDAFNDDQTYTRAASCGFMVVRMRKISSGPPLAPIAEASSIAAECTSLVHVDGICWQPCSDRFSLPAYLRALLAFSEEDPSVIHSCLDGRDLAFYQAVVQRCRWPSVCGVIEPLLKQHRSAYRLFYGGTAAPSLAIDVQPIFLNDKMSFEPAPDDAEDAAWRIRNTFFEHAEEKCIVDEGYLSA